VPESWIATEGQAVNAALAQFRVATSSASDQDLIDRLLFLKAVVRQAEHDALHTIAQLDSDGVFLERGMRTSTAVADLLRCTSAEASRLVATAASVFPTSLAGEPLEPRLPATATALGGWEIDRTHAEVIERLLGKGYDLRIYDRNVSIASLVGANRDFILNRIPHISRLMVDNEDAVLDHAQTIMIGNPDPDFWNVLYQLRNGQSIVDFVRITDRRSENGR